MKSYSVCIIGSSGIAPIYWAWKKRSFPLKRTVSLTFYTGAGGAFDDVVYRDGVFTPESERLKSRFAATSEDPEIVVANYDAFAIYGLGVGINPLFSIYSQVGTLDRFKHGYADQLVSRSCFQRILQAKLERTQCFRLLINLRKAFAGPLIIVPAPLLPEPVFDDKTGGRLPYANDSEFVQSICAEATEFFESALTPFNVDILWQDESTLGRPGTSKAELGYRALNFKGSESKECNKHMNEDFGALMLSSIFARLNEISGGKVLTSASKQTTGRAEPDLAASI